MAATGDPMDGTKMTRRARMELISDAGIVSSRLEMMTELVKDLED